MQVPRHSVWWKVHIGKAFLRDSTGLRCAKQVQDIKALA